MIFGADLTLSVSLMHAYVSWRAASLPFVDRLLPRRLFLALCWVLWLAYLPGRFFRRLPSMEIPAEFSLYWTAIVLLCAVCMSAADLAIKLARARERASRLRGWGLGAGAALSIAAAVQGFRPPGVVSYDVTLPGLPARLDGTVVAAMSDLHLGAILDARWMEKRAEQVRELKPDMILLLGDVIEAYGPARGDVIDSLKLLQAPMGVYAVRGNHESYRRGSLIRMENAGFTILRDSWTLAAPGLVVAGIEYTRRDPPEMVAKALAGHPPGGVIFLAHMPSRTREAAAAGAGLYLAGHTHGGQLWPFGYIVKIKFPLLAGRYNVDGMTAIVSRGAGVWGARMRLWKRGEILRIVLHSPEHTQ